MFVEKYCVFPSSSDENHSQYWLYCKDTNLPLLPKFFVDLANAYESNRYWRCWKISN